MTAKRAVADDVLGRIARVQADLFRRVREGTLDPGYVVRGLQMLVEGRFEDIAQPLRFDKRSEGWRLIEDSNVPTEEISRLVIVPFLKRDESCSAEFMLRQATQMGANLGQRQAEYLLEHKDEIPQPWRNFTLVFPKTRWLFSTTGDLYVPFLFWPNEQGWCLSFKRLDTDWYWKERFVLLSR